MRANRPPSSDFKTLDLKPDHGEMIKPTETIDIIGVESLTLQDRRVWNALIANAFSPALAEAGRDFKIDLAELRASHNGNERIEESIERLMKTIARCRLPDGSVTRFQLLGGNNMADDVRPRGELTYSFDKRLAEVLGDSRTFGKLELKVMAAFSSKYALALYEHVSRRVNLKTKWMEEYSLEDFRAILGVSSNQYKAFGNLKQRVIVPALVEVNHWAHFRVDFSVKKRGQRVTGVMLSWFWKDREGRAKAQEELNKPKVGRKARMKGIEESVLIISPAEQAADDSDHDFFHSPDMQEKS
ncbi:replication initiation protein [uncultured Roseibium sp.]|uniref:replication initiation protein n=1 Tax=uncultured Roseibium sp. TaxID=1936171 RepID=UPI00263A0D47|nr:replication initiation protein [uncultured Roseibium sp.]